MSGDSGGDGQQARTRMRMSGSKRSAGTGVNPSKLERGQSPPECLLRSVRKCHHGVLHSLGVGSPRIKPPISPQPGWDPTSLGRQIVPNLCPFCPWPHHSQMSQMLKTDFLETVSELRDIDYLMGAHTHLLILLPKTSFCVGFSNHF